ncbi:transcriptional regulator [Bradyrhizobium sp.]|uniref:transcriptional regulator n=1 Tax=Bradyrhizobium sp. TaxID=376 RepID=UPI0027346654|nr:transcriptional regulator [Bradyrhizobium sp.]MDP3075758.1 transcriptional regulator [Bradyrhizobium sp.]
MGQQLQQWRSATGEQLWLSALIDTMEEVCGSERRSQPCDRSVVTAVCAQLSRPAAPYAHQGSGFSLRH